MVFQHGLCHHAVCVYGCVCHFREFSYLLACGAPLGGSPSEYCHPVWNRKTRMVWLPYRKNFFWLLDLYYSCLVNFAVLGDIDQPTTCVCCTAETLSTSEHCVGYWYTTVLGYCSQVCRYQNFRGQRADKKFFERCRFLLPVCSYEGFKFLTNGDETF